MEQYFFPDEQLYTHIFYKSKQHLRQRPNGEGAGFLPAYCRMINNETINEDTPRERTKGPTAIGERVKEVAPVVVGLTLQYNQKIEDLPYDDRFIEAIKTGLQQVVSELIQEEHDSIEEDVKKNGKRNRHSSKDVEESEDKPDNASDTLTTVVLTGPKYKKATMWAYDIRLQMPFCRIAVQDQKRYIRPRLLQKYKKENVLDRLLMKTPLVWESILDATALDDTVPLYGSAPGEYMSPMKNVSVFNSFGDQVDINQVEGFDPSLHKDVRERGTVFKTKNKDATYWLPVILSVNYEGGRVYTPVIPQAPEAENAAEEKKLLNEDQEIAEEMLKLISPGRIKKKAYRTKVGKALYNVYKGSQEGLDRWEKWCQQIDDYKIEDHDFFKDEYETFSSGNFITEITLQQYAEEDNRERYNQWYYEKVGELQDEVLELGTQGALARLLFFMNRTSLTFVNKTFYRFNGAYLEENKSDSIDFSELLKLFRLIEQGLNNTPDEVRQQDPRALAQRKKEVHNIIKMVDTSSHVAGITRFLRGMLARRNAKVGLNNDRNILPDARRIVIEVLDEPDDHGHYGLKRPGLLEDFQTFHSDVTLPNWDNDNKWMRKTLRYEKKVYTDPETMKYIRRRRSKNIKGHNQEKRITFIIGPPHSSKTTDLLLTGLAFGSGDNGTFFTTASSAITEKRTNSSGSTPDLAHSNQKKEVVVDDPGMSNSLNESFLQAESGGSARYNRFHFDNGSSSEATAAVSIAANDPLPFSPSLQMMVRLIIVYYNSMFLSPDDEETLGIKVPEDKKEQWRLKIFPKKNMDKYKIKMAQARFQMMFDGLDDVVWDTVIPLPKQIRKDTTDYWNTYDHYTIFVNTHLRPNDDPDIKLHIDAVFDAYEPWFKRKYRALPFPSYNVFRSCMNGVLGQTDKKGYYKNYRLYDKRFEDFVNTLRIVDDDQYLDADIAYREFRNWCENRVVKMNIYDYYSFISYMESSVGKFEEGRGFRGFALPDYDDFEE